MPVDTISSNNRLSQLNQVSKKRELSNYTHDGTDDEDINPAYIVELSERGKQLQRANPVTIVHL
ncbi:hypothetical protein [Sporomusa aerivorans]|uniref:hypothetical protein n=1 Tax=Sporomusa aerivorans TaxID=204936 RepID=UPI00352A644C